MSSSKPKQKHGRIFRFAERRTRAMRHIAIPPSSLSTDGEENTAEVLRSRFVPVIKAGLRLTKGIVLNKSVDGNQSLSFAELCQLWKINKGNYTKVMRGIRREQIAFIFLGLYGLGQAIYGAFHGESESFFGFWSQVLVGSFVALLSVALVSISTWRLDVLQRRRYVSFAQWLRRGHEDTE